MQDLHGTDVTIYFRNAFFSCELNIQAHRSLDAQKVRYEKLLSRNCRQHLWRWWM